MNVLIADDEQIVLEGLKYIIDWNALGFTICATAVNGEEALETYKKVAPDLVTMDIVMPGMDGLDTARLLLQSYPDARVLMVSSLAYEDTIKEAERIGAKGFVYKPFDPEQIVLSVQKAFTE